MDGEILPSRNGKDGRGNVTQFEALKLRDVPKVSHFTVADGDVN